MPVTPTPAFTQAITSTHTILTSSTTLQAITAGVPTNTVLIASNTSAGAAGSLIKSINVTTNGFCTSTTPLTLYFWQVSGSVYTLLGTVIVPIYSGFGAGGIGAVASYDVLADPYMTTFAIDQSGKPTLLLPNGHSLYVGLKASLVSPGAAWITVTKEEF